MSHVLPQEYRQKLTKSPGAVGANGVPLDVVGRAKLAVSLGPFTSEEEFTVIRNLTVDCPLGADFLKDHGAIMDCRSSTLSIGKKSRCHIPMIIGQRQATTSNVAVIAHTNMEIPGRTIQLIQGELKGDCTNFSEKLIEPMSGAPPTNVCVARSLSPVLSGKEVILQVMNISPTLVTIFKGMRLGEAIPRHSLLLMDNMKDIVTSQEDQLQAPNIDLDSTDLTSTEKAQLKDLLNKYADLFAPKTRPIGRTPTVKHSTPTEGPPIRQPLRRIPETLKSVVDEEVTKMLDQGVEKPSNSPWSSPIVMVKKKDGSWRFCVDYCKLNSVTHQDAYPLPRIDSTLDSLAGAAYFTTLDLASCYWQVEVEEQDKEKTAFSTPKGHFEFNVMPFGLTNAPSTFQCLMECVLAGLTQKQCLIYLDDIVVFSKSFEEHLGWLTNVFQALRRAGLTLQFKKCHFAQRQVRYLGHVVSAAGIHPDPAKTEAVSTYPVPNNAKELRQFLGLANYYRCFVADYSKIAEPLHKLLTKETSFSWDSKCHNAFEELKRRLVSPPILAFPDFSKQFVLYTDASDTAIGGVLSQNQDGQERVILYWSRQLQKAERNYSTIEKEALAAVAAIKEFYPYLYGLNFKLVTDHNPLTSLKGLKDVGGRITRWMMFLQHFNFRFEYKPGKNHGNADAMSRRPPSVDVVATVHQLELDPHKMKSAQLADEKLAPVIKELEKGEPLPASSAPGLRKTFLQNGLLCRKFQSTFSSAAKTQLEIPSNMKEIVLQQTHDNQRHLGIRKTTESVKEQFFWPGNELDIELWVRECLQCQ